MYSYGESIYGAELCLRQAPRAVEARQAQGRISPAPARRRHVLWDACRRKVAALGRGLSELGSTLKPRVVPSGRADVQ